MDPIRDLVILRFPDIRELSFQHFLDKMFPLPGHRCHGHFAIEYDHNWSHAEVQLVLAMLKYAVSERNGRRSPAPGADLDVWLINYDMPAPLDLEKEMRHRPKWNESERKFEHSRRYVFTARDRQFVEVDTQDLEAYTSDPNLNDLWKAYQRNWETDRSLAIRQCVLPVLACKPLPN